MKHEIKKTVITKREAYRLSVLKWKWIVENDGSNNSHDLIADIPEISELKVNCGYCEKYYKTNKKTICGKCPLAIIPDYEYSHCCHKKHPFDIWAFNCSKNNAQAVLDLIRKTK